MKIHKHKYHEVVLFEAVRIFEVDGVPMPPERYVAGIGQSCRKCGNRRVLYVGVSGYLCPREKTSIVTQRQTDSWLAGESVNGLLSIKKIKM